MSAGDIRVSDEVSTDYSRGLRDEIGLLRQALAALTAEVTVLRVAQATLSERIGRPGYAALVAGVIVTISVLGSIATMTYWGGQISSRMEIALVTITELRTNITQHVAQERIRTLKKEDWE